MVDDVEVVDAGQGRGVGRHHVELGRDRRAGQVAEPGERPDCTVARRG